MKLNYELKNDVAYLCSQTAWQWSEEGPFLSLCIVLLPQGGWVFQHHNVFFWSACLKGLEKNRKWRQGLYKPRIITAFNRKNYRWYSSNLVGLHRYGRRDYIPVREVSSSKKGSIIYFSVCHHHHKWPNWEWWNWGIDNNYLAARGR